MKRAWLVVMICSMICPLTTLGQMALPFSGQGKDPEEPVDVYVSAMMERLLDVDDRHYLFENIVYIYLSWVDSRAYSSMLESSRSFRNGTLEECLRPCSSASAGSLSRLSEGFHYHDTCCDGIWLPTIQMLNVYELPEGRLQPYGVIVDEGSSSVAWYVGVHAKYFTPMDFHRFPFDTQVLDMQFSFEAEIDPAIRRFIPSASSTRFLVKGEGDPLSGWAVSSLEIIPSKQSLQAELDYFIGEFGELSVPQDPKPITGIPGRPGYLGQAERVSFDIYIRIDRFWKYYVLNMIVPILLLVALSLITYIIPAESLDARIALNVTLFLSLTALQFVINDQLPKSSYPSAVTELILVCYLAVAFGVPETIVVFAIASSNKVKEDALRKQMQSVSAAGEECEEAETPVSSNMSLVMKVMKRKKSGKVPFIIDMVCLVLVVVTVVTSATIIIVG